MSLSLNLKLINSVYKFYEDKQGDLPVYFGNDVSEFSPARGNLETEGKYIDTTGLDKLARDFFRDEDIALSGFGMLYRGALVKEYYKEPYTKDFRRVSYSVCKTVVSLAVGIACDKGLLTTDTKVCSIFPEHNGIFLKKNIKNLTVEHLLTMTAGVYFDEIKAFFSYDWRKDFMGSEVLFPPGKEFYYNSLNSYMLGACVSKVADMPLMEFLQENLFTPMGITDITWDKCPMGLPRGGWGMKLSLRDMLKIGQLILNKGGWRVDGKKTQLVSKSYINRMCSHKVDIKDKRLVVGYGYGIWILKDGALLLNGVFGQNVYINIERKIVIATCGSACELFPDGKLVETIMEFVKKNFSDTQQKRINFNTKVNKLRESLTSLSYKRPLDKELNLIRRNLSLYMGNTYRFKDYASSVLPLMTQIMYSNYMTGIDGISLEVIKDNFYIKFKEKDTDIKLRLGYSHKRPYEYQIINIGGKEIPVAASGKLLYDEDKRLLLRIHLVFLEEVSNKIFKIYFQDESIRLKSYETPDLLRFTNKFINDDRLLKIRRFKDYITPDYITYKAKKILRPHVIGYIDN